MDASKHCFCFFPQCNCSSSSSSAVEHPLICVIMHSASLETRGALTIDHPLKEKGPQQNNCVFYVQGGENYQGIKFIVQKVLGLPIRNSVAGRHYEVHFFDFFKYIFCRNKKAKNVLMHN